MPGLFGSPFGKRNKVEMAASMAMPQQPQEAAQTKQDKPYYETLAGKLGAAGTILLSRGRSNPYAEARAQEELLQRQMQFRAQQAMQERQWGNEDWRLRQEYKRANPDPVNNDTVNDVNWYMSATPEQKAAYHALHPEYRVGPDGRFYPVQVAPPSAPVGKLTPITGGTAGNGGGSFPSGY